MEAVKQVRLLIADMADSPIFEDDQLSVFLELNKENAYRAAAAALKVMAVSEVMVAKVIRTQDLQTSGDKVSAELRALAKEYEARADADEVADEVSFFGVIPFGDDGRLEGEEYRCL